jgi:hypothetical protein
VGWRNCESTKVGRCFWEGRTRFDPGPSRPFHSPGTGYGRGCGGIWSVGAGTHRSALSRGTHPVAIRRKGLRSHPFGFRRDGDHLVADHGEQRVVRQVLDLRDSGASYRTVAGWLNREGITAKRGGSWSPMAVRSVCLTSARRARLQT